MHEGFLVLTVKVNASWPEPIHIINEETGEEIHIEILDIKANHARIGINANSNYKILRDKLYRNYIKNDNG